MVIINQFYMVKDIEVFKNDNDEKGKCDEISSQGGNIQEQTFFDLKSVIAELVNTR